MPDDRLHRATPEVGEAALPRWARAVGLRADPPLRRPPAPHLEPVHRSWLGAYWQARAGVQAGMSLDDFLRSRLARYLASLPVPRSRLPLTVDVEDGLLRVRAVPASPPPPPQDACDPWLAPLVALEGPSVRQEVAELEIRMGMLDGQIEAARRRAEERGRQLASDVAAGLVAAPPDVEASAEQLGRPPIRSGASRALALAFAATALAAETWQVAQPLLRTAGVDPATLRAETARRPGEVVLAAIFALAVGAGLFALAHAGLAATLELFRGDGDDRRRRWLASASLGAGAPRDGRSRPRWPSLPGAAAGPRPPAAAFVLLLIAVPLAAALVLRGASGDGEQRAAELAAALAWDRERARSLGERARRLEEVVWAEEESRGLERQRDAARRRLRELSARAVGAARIAAEAEQRERAALARVAQGLVGALELDRYEFVRQASARGAHELFAPRRRSVSDASDPVASDATTEPQIQPAGRLAS